MSSYPVSWPSLLAHSWAFLLRNKVLWLEVPGALNWEVCAGLLGASLILCMVTKSTSTPPPQWWVTTGLGQHCLGMGCICQELLVPQ